MRNSADGTGPRARSTPPAPRRPAGTQPGGAAGHAEITEPDPRRWKALAVCLVAGFMTLLDVSIVNVALPSIRVGLHATQSDLQWVLSGYALTFGLVLVPSGRFGDARGRRTVFIAGVALFTLASVGAGIAPTALLLVVARLIQGVAGGIVNPQISGLIQQLFRPAERGRPFGLLGATIGVSTAVGPLLGGLLIQAAGTAQGWRWVFYVNLPVGIVAIVLAYRLIPVRPAEQRPVRADARRATRRAAPVGRRQKRRAGPVGRRQESLDPVGVLLLGTGVLLLLLPLVQEQQWHGRGKWLLVPLAAAVLVGFVAWERRYARRGTPLVDLSLFRLRSYALGTLIALLYFAGFTSIFFIFTLYLQAGLGYSALQAGLAITPFALGSAGAAGLGGRVVVRFGRPMIAIGLVMVAVGLAAVVLADALVPAHGTALATAGPFLVAGIGSGLVIAPNQTLTLAEVPVRGAGSAGAVLQTGQRIGTAIGIATVGSVFFARLASTHGDWAQAFRRALVLAIGFVVVSLAAAMVDVLRR